MNKLLRQVLSTTLAVSLVASLCPIGSEAAQVSENGSVQSYTEQANPTGNSKEKNYVEGEVLIVTRNVTTDNASKKINAVQKEAKTLGVVIEDTQSVELTKGKSVLQVSKVTSDKYSTEELVKLYEKSKNVEAVQPNYKYHALDIDQKDYTENLWALDNQGQNGGTVNVDINSNSSKIKMAAGEESKEKVVAVIDSGVDYTHSMLSDHIWNNPYPAYLAGEHGYDFVNYDKDPMDDNGHGSHCSGIISSVMNGDNIKIMPLKFLNSSGEGDTYGAISAYYYIYAAQKLGVDVVAINNSWEGASDEADTLLQQVIDLVGTNGAISLCAAGNESENLEDVYTCPASLNSEYIVSVAAANERGELASFSNYGAEEVDVAAPGADILSSVSYNNFNPSVYGKDTDGKQKLCSVYQEFNGTLVTPDTPSGSEFSNLTEDSIPYFTATADDDVEQQVEITKKDYFGTKEDGGKSLLWTVKNGNSDNVYKLYLPYQQEESDTPVYLNLMVRAKGCDSYIMDFLGTPLTFKNGISIFDAELQEDGTWAEGEELASTQFSGQQNYWEQISVQKSKKEKTAGKHAICIQISPCNQGEFSIGVDDFAISKSNVAEEELGKTAYYNGTSMATPYVAGAVAAMANAYPKDTVEERIARIKGAVTETEGLKGKVASNGILDLEHADQQATILKGVSINNKGQLEITGMAFPTNVTVMVNGKEASVIKKDSKKILVSGSFYNQHLDIRLVMGERTLGGEYYISKGKQMDLIANSYSDLYDYVTDGVYWVNGGHTADVVHESGMVWRLYGDEFDGSEESQPLFICGGIADSSIFEGGDNESVYLSGKPISLNSQLYGIAVKGNAFSTEAALVKVDEETANWVFVTALPDGYADLNKLTGFYAYKNSTLTAYNGKIYLIGGLDEVKGQPVKDVYVYDIAKNQWSKSADLPEARFASNAVQVGNKLVVTLGGNGTEACPQNLIFDGKNWSVSKADIKALKLQSKVMDIENVSGTTYYSAEVSPVKDGLIYVDNPAEKLGDLFTYQLSSDKYQATGYSRSCVPNSRHTISGTLADKLYILAGHDTEEAAADSKMLVYTMDVQPATYKVSGESDDEAGYLIGVGDYLPGSEVNVGAGVYEDYYLKSLKVNKTSVPVSDSDETTTTIKTLTGDVNIQAEYGAYVTGLKLSNKLTMAPGSTKKLKVSVLPQRADNKALKFKSSNTKVATVDAKGNIKINKNAKVGKKVVIRVTAKDRNTVYETCTITIKKPVKVKKITLSTKNNTTKIKAGKTLKVTAKINPAKADNTTLKWSSSNKKYATVKNGKVTAKKAGIGKTVTIKAQATDGSKVKASIKLKIVK